MLKLVVLSGDAEKSLIYGQAKARATWEGVEEVGDTAARSESVPSLELRGTHMRYFKEGCSFDEVIISSKPRMRACVSGVSTEKRVRMCENRRLRKPSISAHSQAFRTSKAPCRTDLSLSLTRAPSPRTQPTPKFSSACPCHRSATPVPPR